MDFEIDQKDLEDIDEALLDEELPNKFRRKLLTLKMRNAGAPLEMISASLEITVRSVSNYIAEYRDGGLEACLEDRAYAPLSSVDPHIDQIEESFKQSPVGSSRQARRRIAEITGVELSLSQTRRIMKRLGMRYRKAGQIPGKAKPDEQLEFLNEKRGRRVDIGFVIQELAGIPIRKSGVAADHDGLGCGQRVGRKRVHQFHLRSGIAEVGPDGFVDMHGHFLGAVEGLTHVEIEIAPAVYRDPKPLG